jgi:beta-glucuronidase
MTSLPPSRATRALAVVGLALAGASLLDAQERFGGRAAEKNLQDPVASLIMNVPNREKVALSGQWRFIIDEVERGLRTQYPRYTIPLDETQQRGGMLVEYEWDSAPEITVPGDWNGQDPRWLWYRGLAWYRRRFDAPAANGKRVLLHFEGANYFTHVYVNGKKIGEHEGGFTPFAFDITDQLRPTGNSLVVGVSNEKLPTGIPVADSDWWNYGGITRPVWLVLIPDTHIKQYSVALTPSNGRDQISGQVTLAGPARGNAMVTVRLPELGIRVPLTTDSMGRARFTATPRGLVRWSPEQPRRYQLIVESPRDTTREQVGFRTVSVRGTELLLNDKPIFLRGISIHEESFGERASTTSRHLSEPRARALLDSARALGANFVRLSHYPHTETMVRMADSLGLLVWSEIPVYQNDIKYDNPATLALARRMQRVNLTRDANRAAVIIWSVANETPINDARNAFLRAMIGDIRQQDPNRLISAALNRTSGDGLTQVIDDPLGNDLDLLAVNEYYGWYGQFPVDSIQAMKWVSKFEKPLIFTEFGADAKQGHRGDRRDRWTEDHQAWFYSETLKMVDRIPSMRGMSPWILKDFRSPRRYHPRFQEYWNRKGILSETGQRKMAFDTLATYYKRRASEGNRQ